MTRTSNQPKGRRAINRGRRRDFTATHGQLVGQVSAARTRGYMALQAGALLLPHLLPRPSPATDTGRQARNIGPEGGHPCTVLDSLPITTDQKVGGSSPSEPALFSQVIALRALDLVTSPSSGRIWPDQRGSAALPSWAAGFRRTRWPLSGISRRQGRAGRQGHPSLIQPPFPRRRDLRRRG